MFIIPKRKKLLPKKIKLTMYLLLCDTLSNTGVDSPVLEKRVMGSLNKKKRKEKKEVLHGNTLMLYIAFQVHIFC